METKPMKLVNGQGLGKTLTDSNDVVLEKCTNEYICNIYGEEHPLEPPSLDE